MTSKSGQMLVQSILEDIENLKQKVQKLKEELTPIKKKIDEKEILLNSLEKGLISLDMAKDIYKNDKECVMTAIAFDASNFQYASDLLKNDEEVVNLAVTSKGEMILHANKRFINNYDMVKLALETNLEVSKYLSDSLKIQIFTPNYIIDILDKDGDNLQYTPIDYRKIKSYCDIAIISNPNSYRFCLNEEIINDRNLALHVVSFNGLLLEFVKEDFKKDFEIIVKAVTNNKEAKKYICPLIKENIIKAFG